MLSAITLERCPRWRGLRSSPRTRWAGGTALRFGRFEIDAAGLELRCDGARVEVQPLVLALLAHLARHPDVVVTKDELAHAVWKDPETSDEVIARAVMKARRAIGDNAQAPVHIFTEPGRGFRFRGAEVRDAPAAVDEAVPAVSWRVLPFVNRSENPSLDWACIGLQRMLCHVMQSSAIGLGVSAEPSGTALAADRGMPSCRVVRALAERPGVRWVACEFDNTPTGHRLDLAWAGPDEPVVSLNFHGETLPELLLAAAGQLVPPQAWQREVAQHHPRAWAQLHDVIAQMRRWPDERASEQLTQCFDRLPRHPLLQLQRIRLLMQLQALPEAAAAIEEAQRMLAADGQTTSDAVLAVQLQGATIAAYQGDVAKIKAICGEVRALLERHPASARTGSVGYLLWALLGWAHAESNEWSASAAACEQASRHALRAGLMEEELRARAGMANAICHWDPHRAEELLRALAERALELGLLNVAGDAMACLANSLHIRGCHEQSKHWGERALAVVLPGSGDWQFLQEGRYVLAQALVSSGDFAQAEAVLKRYGRRSVNELDALKLQTYLHWRQGRLAEADRGYCRLLGDTKMTAIERENKDLRAEHATLLALMGRVQEGRATLMALPRVGLPMLVARAHAALAMAEGRRDEARRVLSEAAPQATLENQEAYRVVLDLGWLSLESGDESMAEEMLDRAITMEVETVERDWLALALQDRLHPADPGAWNVLRARSPSLGRHCPWLGTPDDVQARRQGRAAPLPNLLSVLAW